MIARSDRWWENPRASDRWWPPIGARVRYRSYTRADDSKAWFTGKVVFDTLATSHRVAIRRDGEKKRRVVFRNRTLVERIDGD